MSSAGTTAVGGGALARSSQLSGDEPVSASNLKAAIGSMPVGRLLWEGSCAYDAASLNVPGSSAYSVFYVLVEGFLHNREETEVSFWVSAFRGSRGIYGVTTASGEITPTGNASANRFAFSNYTCWIGFETEGDTIKPKASNTQSNGNRFMFYFEYTNEIWEEDFNMTQIWGIA